MSPLLFVITLFAASLGAGFLGSLIGLGGGIVVVPVLTLVYRRRGGVAVPILSWISLATSGTPASRLLT